MSWMITRCARCCLIWSQPTMPLTVSFTPPKAFIHHWFYLSVILTLSLKLKTTILPLWLWEGSEFMLGQVLLSTVCVSQNATCNLAYQGSPVLWHPPLAFIQMCDNPLHHWLFTLPFSEQLIPKFVLYCQKGLIFILKFCRAATIKHDTVALLFGTVGTWTKGCKSQNLCIIGKMNLYFFLFGILIIHYLLPWVSLAFFALYIIFFVSRILTVASLFELIG